MLIPFEHHFLFFIQFGGIDAAGRVQITFLDTFLESRLYFQAQFQWQIYYDANDA